MRYYPNSSGPAFLQARRQAAASNAAAPAAVAAPSAAPAAGRSATATVAPPRPLAVPVATGKTPAKVSPIRLPASLTPARDSIAQRLALPFAVAFVFLRFSFLHEIISERLGINPYLLLLIGFPAVVLSLLCEGWRNALTFTAARFWVLYGVWMVIDVPFSIWKGDSLNSVIQFWRVSLVMLMIITAVCRTLQECYRFMWAIGLAAVVNVLLSSDSVGQAERLSIQFGSIANSNDYAAHLLLVLPFLLWIGLVAGAKLIRVAAVLTAAAGLVVGARTGSRGAFLAICVVALFMAVRSKGMAKIAYALVIPAVLIVSAVFLPQQILDRYRTIFDDNKNVSSQAMVEEGEALASTEARRYLLKTSLDVTIQHPIFGVGPNEFDIMEGDLAKAAGRHGAWQVTHNTYTQVSSEDGIPALIFFLAAIATTFHLLGSLYKRTGSSPQFRKLRLACFCLMVSMVGFCTAVIFLSLAYSMYLPTMTGLAIALTRAARKELPPAMA